MCNELTRVMQVLYMCVLMQVLPGAGTTRVPQELHAGAPQTAVALHCARTQILRVAQLDVRSLGLYAFQWTGRPRRPSSLRHAGQFNMQLMGVVYM
jgi:hypothetical protein